MERGQWRDGLLNRLMDGWVYGWLYGWMDGFFREGWWPEKEKNMFGNTLAKGRSD